MGEFCFLGGRVKSQVVAICWRVYPIFSSRGSLVQKRGVLGDSLTNPSLRYCCATVKTFHYWIFTLVLSDGHSAVRCCETDAHTSLALLLSLWIQPKEVRGKCWRRLRAYWGQTGMALSLGSFLTWEIKGRNDDFPAWTELWASIRPLQWKRWVIRGGLWCKELPLSGQQGGRWGNNRKACAKKCNWFGIWLGGNISNVFQSSSPSFFCFLSFPPSIFLIWAPL